MAITITNLNPDLTVPLIESIEAQTAFMEAQSSTYGTALNTIYNTPLCSSGPSAEDVLGPADPVCCTEDILQDTPGLGDRTVRQTCSDGSVIDTVTFAVDADAPTGTQPVVCTFTRKSADPSGTTVEFDENCQEIVTDGIVSTCKARVVGEPYPEYFIPRVSDFGNQIYCVPGSRYAFAWSGVTNINIKKFLEENAGAIDLDDETNQYVAVVNGQAFACGSNDVNNAYTYGELESNGNDANGDPYYCSPYNGDGFAHTVADPAFQTSATRAFDNMGDPIPCNLQLHPLQNSQSNRLDGCFSPIASICPAWDGQEADAPAPETDDEGGFLDFFIPDECAKAKAPPIEGKTAQDAYYMLWQDYWQCEKRSKCMQQYLYRYQLPLAIAGLITSIGTYNKILDKDLDILCTVEEDIGLVGACSAALMGTDEEPGILKQCQSALLEGHNDRLGTINNRGEHACALACDELDCYDKLWKPIQERNATRLASHLHTMIENGKITSEYTQSWADGLQDCVTENMLPELKRQFAPLMGSMNCTSNNLNEWRDDLRERAKGLSDHFYRTYQKPEATLIPEIMDMSACMTQRICELRDWLYDSARCDDAVYKEGYQQGEIPQARAAMATSAQLLPKIVESVSWLEKNLCNAQDIFQACFATGQGRLNPELWNNAQDLAPEVVRCFNWFKENAQVDRKFFDECYRDRECRLVKQQLEFACSLTSRAEDSLNRLDKWSINDRKMFDKQFRSLEIASTKDVAHNGQLASNEMHDFGHWFDERTKEFHDTFHQHWLPCDIENLKQHCEVWTRNNPLQAIERNNEQLNKLSTRLQEVTDKGLIYADTFLDEAFKAADEFDYCVETPAYLHVRRQIDRALQELETCTPNHCTGHLIDARTTLKAEGARAEGAAFEAATRWKWWANDQLQKTRFNQKLETLKLLDAYALRTLDANKTETAGHDILLNHMREALIRGYTYLNNTQEAGRTTSGIQSTEVDALLKTIQLWHFWPELAQQGNIAFNNGVFEVQNDAQALLQLGHFWPEMANREKLEATKVVDQSIDVGMRMSQLGQFYAQQAESMNAQRTAAANTAGQLGLQYGQLGHDLHRIAADKTGTALSSSLTGSDMGLKAGQLGAQHMATALEIENRMTLNALEHLKAGIGAFGVGIDFLQEVRQAYQLSGSYGIPASGQMMNLFETGQKSAILGLTANEQCYDINYQMLCKAKDYVQKNFAITQSSLHGGTAGTLNAANQLLSQQGDNVGGAFGLLGNSLQGIFSNNSSPPFPTGGTAFGVPGAGGAGIGF